MAPAARPLDYGPKLAVHRRRWARRAVVYALLLPVVLLAAVQVGLTVRDRSAKIVATRECLSFSVPSGTVAWEEVLGDQASDAVILRLMDCNKALAGFGCTMSYQSSGGRTLLFTLPAAEWRRRKAERSGASNYSMAGRNAVFLHGLRATAGGPERLVMISLTAEVVDRLKSGAAGDKDAPVLRATVIRPATWAGGEAEVSARAVPVAGLAAAPFGSLRFYFGQPDPIDRSHFTLDFDAPGREGTIDGYLMPDDSVKLEARPARGLNGPAATPRPGTGG